MTNKERLDSIQRTFTGWWSLKAGKKYVQFPKLAPHMTVSMLMFALGDIWNILPMFIAGAGMTFFCIFCFHFLRIFPKRKTNGLTRVN